MVSWTAGHIGSDTVGVFGKATSSDDYAVLGENSGTGCAGYIGYTTGMAGVHTSSNNNGYLGGSDVGAYGAAMSGSSVGVKGEHVASLNHGYLGGDSVAVFGYTGNFNDYAVLGQNDNASSVGYLGGEQAVYGLSVMHSTYGYIGGEEGGMVGGYPTTTASFGALGSWNNHGASAVVYGEAESSAPTQFAGYFEGDVGVSGEVGIGTDDPVRSLHVSSASSSYGMVRLENSNTGSNETTLGFKNGSDAANSEIWVMGVGPWTDKDNFAIGRNADFLVIDHGGDVGIGTDPPAYKLDVAGDIECTLLHETSDVRFKANIEPLADALRLIAQIQGVSFDWRTEEFPEHGFTDRRQIGFVAQELKDIVPELVSEDDNGYLSIDYTRLTPVLVEAMKELKAENDELRDRLAKIEALLEQIADNQ